MTLPLSPDTVEGLTVGLTIVGFGLSPLISAPLANQLIGLYTVRPTLQLCVLSDGIFGDDWYCGILRAAQTRKLFDRQRSELSRSRREDRERFESILVKNRFWVIDKLPIAI